MTQQKLADAAGVSVGTISAIERGTGHPSRRIVDAVEFALLSNAFRRERSVTGRRMTVDEIARIFDKATVVPIDVADVSAYQVRMLA
jgi:transcriptional regulator with XRE-family HTH domain